ncbi:MAG: hypothetical protein ACHQZS_07175 [Candidatus Binatales bacterium]
METDKSQYLEPIKITGMIADEVGIPRNDGGLGSDLYEVPFQLSQKPSDLWAQLFVDSWNRPPEFTSMHRPGIARVEGDRIVLDGTTIEEVERYHLKTLKLAVQRANELTVEWFRSRQQRDRGESERQEEHRRRVKEAAKRLRFD